MFDQSTHRVLNIKGEEIGDLWKYYKTSSPSLFYNQIVHCFLMVCGLIKVCCIALNVFYIMSIFLRLFKTIVAIHRGARDREGPLRTRTISIKTIVELVERKYRSTVPTAPIERKFEKRKDVVILYSLYSIVFLQAFFVVLRKEPTIEEVFSKRKKTYISQKTTLL